MKLKILEVLPNNVKELAERIEEYSGTKIGITDKMDQRLIKNVNSPALAITINEKKADLVILDKTKYNAQSVLHELLHLERFWIKGIPQFIAKDDKNQHLTSTIDNQIEHIFIVPEEEKYGYERYSYWNEVYRESFSKFPPKDIQMFSLKGQCIFGLIHSKILVNDKNIQSLITSKIRDVGLLQFSKNAERFLMKNINDKEKTIKAIVSILEIPIKDVQLKYIDIKNRKAIYKEIS